MNCSYDTERKFKSSFRMAAPQNTDACLRNTPSAGSLNPQFKPTLNQTNPKQKIKCQGGLSAPLCTRAPFWSQLSHPHPAHPNSAPTDGLRNKEHVPIPELKPPL